MPVDIATFCQALTHSQLLTPEELAQVERLRRLMEKEGADPERLPAWLVSHQYLTPFQAQRLVEGRANHFFLGRYKLLGRLGQGAMARVYKAVCPNGELFAVKVLTPSRAGDPRWRPLFEQEVNDASRFRHPRIVRTFEAGQADGLRYLVMEYLEGETLAKVLQRRGRLPVPEAVRLVSQALEGLEYLRAHRSVHCNLDPSHLMLVPACGEADTTLDSSVKILDAGLGRPVFNVQLQEAGEKISADGEVTLQAQVDYLAAELAERPEQADIRADIYSLGCILYHCLAGQPPYPGGTSFNKLLRHATESPHPLIDINPQVTEGLQLVVGRMMARHPDGRYADPAAAARALVAFLPAERTATPIPVAVPCASPVAAPVPAASEPVVSHVAPARQSRQHKARAAVVLGLLALVAALALWPRGSTEKTPTGTDEVAAAAAPVGEPGEDATPSPPSTGPAQEHQPDPPPTASTRPPPDTSVPRESRPSKEPPKENKPPKEQKPAPPPRRDSQPKWLPVPLEKDQVRALMVLREVFRPDYARTSPVDRRALAQKLLSQGLDTRDDVVARYVLLREARDLAAQAADVVLALRALEQLSREYAVDEVKEKIDIFRAAARTTVAVAFSKTLAETILDTVPEAVARDDFPAAQQLVALAEPVARRALNRPLQQRVDLLNQSLKEIQEERQRLQAAGIDPGQSESTPGVPLDAAASLKLGRFFCFYKGDWARGLPLLAAGSDEALRELAREDLAGQAQSPAWVRCGDGWWQLAEASQGTARRQLQSRALHWYQQALPGLKGLTRTRIEQRIKLVAGS